MWKLVILFAACTSHAPRTEVLVGGPCEGCELIFIDRPVRLASASRIAPPDEPGEPMVIDGVVRTATGAPVPGVVVYAYQTNARGIYPPSTTRHGTLRGFALSGSDGAYRFSTIRPASYPDTTVPQHVHMHVLEVGRCHYYIDDLVFTDDPLLTPAERTTHAQGRGGIGIATPTKHDGTWQVRRDITLGAGIADHARCR
jgi:protocatechuate 3,4-dioxygenase beta subunit